MRGQTIPTRRKPDVPYLWLLGDVLGAVADESDRLHARVGEGGVAGELGEALDGVLERVDDGQEILLE